MKRRGTSRRQVLDLDTNSSSPKRSWQTKYQQIYMDHLNNSTTPSVVAPVAPPAAQNGSDTSESRLPQLVGYTSDSEGDEPKKSTGDIDSKVQDFLKEISDIVPSAASNPDSSSIDDESSRDSFKRSKSKRRKVTGPSLPGSLAAQQPVTVQGDSQQPTIAWQECYDENSGCYYFWNVETNEVTWEMPEALRLYRVALEQWNAQQLLLAQQAVGAIPGFAVQPSTQPEKKQETNKTREQEKSKNKRSKPTNSESEDERIELITSYGPNSDDDSDSSSSHRSSKKKKIESTKLSKKEKKKENEIAIGPQLPPGYIMPVEVKEVKPLVSEILRSEPEKTDVTQKEPEAKKKKEIVIKVKSKPLTDNVETDTKDQRDFNKINALQRLKKLKNQDSDDSSEGSDSSEASDTTQVKVKEKNKIKYTEENEEEEDDEDDDEGVEDSILERLKNQAKILKELGGEIPEEIKELLETNSDSEKDKVPTPPNEKEEPIGKISNVKFERDIKSEQIWPDIETTVKAEDVPEKLIVVNSESGLGGKINSKTSEAIVPEIKEADNLQSDPTPLSEIDKVNEKKLPEKAPTSFSLIAGYGNEEDSDPEEEREVEDKSIVNGKPAPLFPIIPVVEENKVDQTEIIKVEKTLVKNANMKVIKLSAKAKELIHSSTTTEKARATEFVATAEGLKPASSVVAKENETLDLEPKVFPEPVKKVSRKKRLEVPVIKKQEKQPKVETLSKETPSNKKHQDIFVNDTRPKTTEEVEEKVEIVAKPSSSAYTSTWAYNSELKGGEYRGFGYGHDFDIDQKPKAKKGMIQFVKADTLMPKTEPVVNIPDKKLPDEQMKLEDESSSGQGEQTKELAQLITEKVQFLCEGKDVVPSVQVMAIQLETLTTAHSAGGLSVQYLWQWLTSLDGQLASLEQAAAPQGWLCQWDRSYKRYYYRNEETGKVQWDYPEITVPAEPPSQPPAQSQGGEEAMELCDSPPPPQPPATPPPPRISMSRSPSPIVPDEPAPPLPPMPPPPPVISEQPPLPPLPPSESPPPPPLPPSPPPPPPPPIISIAPGEPLPPGVDMTDAMFESSRPPLPAVPPLPPRTPPPPPPPPEISETVDQPVYNIGFDVSMPYDSYQMQPVAPDYNSGMYQYSGTNNGGGDYVIARPPASNPVPPPPVTSLATELDSFYNEVAALEPPLPPQEPSPSPPPPPTSPPPPQQQPATAEVQGKKKKKTKLAPGLALKKKGVSSLVAKWQQVQQDVRREAASEETES